MNFQDYKEEKYIVFLDILGFKSIINNIDNEIQFDNIQTLISELFLEKYIEDNCNKEIEFINNIYNKSPVISNYLSHTKIETTCISDSLIMSSCDLIRLIMAVANIQFNLLAKKKFNKDNNNNPVNFLTRGKLTKGNFIHDSKNNILYGEAYQRALEGEKLANYPRVIIDNRIINENVHFIKQDKDGLYFINYLICLLFSCNKNNQLDNIENFINHSKNKYFKNQNIYSKYYWLNSYLTEIRNIQLSKEEISKFKEIYSNFYEKKHDF